MSAGRVVSQFDRFEPLRAEHPGVGTRCCVCDTPLRLGDRPALVEQGPFGEEDRAKAEAGRPHNVECSLAHQSCAFTNGIARTDLTP